MLLAKAAKALRKSVALAKLPQPIPSNRIPFDPAKAELARLLHLLPIALTGLLKKFMALTQRKRTFWIQNSLLAD